MDSKKWIIVGIVVALVVGGGLYFKNQSETKAEKAAAVACLDITEDAMDELSSLRAAWNGSGLTPEEAQSGTEDAEDAWSDVRDSELKGACKQAGEAIDDAITEYGMVYSAWSDGYDECNYDYYCTEDASDYGWNYAADYMNSGEAAVNRAEAILTKIEEGELSAQ